MPSPNPHSRAGVPGLRDQVLRECAEMVRYALASGLRVPPQSIETVERARLAPADGSDLAALAAAHGRLAKLVSPATPRALVLLAEESTRERGRLSLPGPIRLVRRMVVAALASLALFIASSLSRYVTDDAGGVLNLFGMDLFANEVFWLASAGVGASFAMLFQVNEYVVNRSYDPKYESSYWIKFMIGVIAGFILVALVPLDGLGGSAGEAGAGAEGVRGLAKPTLAMLGGFSASAVYRILNRLISTVEGLFRGDPREEAALREQAATQRAEEEHAAARLGVAAKLVELRQQIAAGAAPDVLQRQLAEVVASLVPADATSPSPTVPAGEGQSAARAQESGSASEGADAGGASADGSESASDAPGKIQVPAIAGAPEPGT
jgi:hypothetical protein